MTITFTQLVLSDLLQDSSFSVPSDPEGSMGVFK